MLSKNNKSGVKGVCFETRANKWRAYIGFAGEKIRLGYFSSFDEAVSARKNAEVLYGRYKGDIILYAKNCGAKVWREESDAYILSSLISYALYYPSVSDMWNYTSWAVKNLNVGVGRGFGKQCHNVNDIFDAICEVLEEGKDFTETSTFDAHLFLDYVKGMSLKNISAKYSMSKSGVNRKITKIVNAINEAMKKG